MSDRQSSDSEDEGFESHRITIDEQQLVQNPSARLHHSTQLAAMYIMGEGVIRKEHPQSMRRVRTIPRIPGSFERHHHPNINNNELPTVHQMYLNARQYWPVYSRFDEPFGHGRNIFSHEVSLQCCKQYPPQAFRPLPEWRELSQEGTLANRLLIDSKLQGGNLLCAFKHRKQLNTYTLFMQNDTNTYGYNQWFYFSVENAHKGTPYTFKIANFKKPYGNWVRGQQPVVFSLNKSLQEENGWFRAGTGIRYYQSSFSQPGCGNFYTLEFTIEFPYESDYLTLSPSLPYSYSKLLRTLNDCQDTARKNKLHWEMQLISHTLANNQVPYITLSKEEKSNKPSVVVMARQHSGEVWSSHFADELMRQLVEQKSNWAKWMLENFTFRIIPMVNIDGVIYGNFRCDLAGYDLNRCWSKPSLLIHPHLNRIKQTLAAIKEQGKVEMYLDLHTHSRDIGAFAYCSVDSEAGRELPTLISKHTSIFRLPACTFGLSKEKMHTARAAMFSLASTLNTMTIQLSAFGHFTCDKRAIRAYEPITLGHLASALLKAFRKYIDPTYTPPKKESKDRAEDKTTNQQLEVEQEQQKLPPAPPSALIECVEEMDMQVQGSDSEPQIDEMEIELKMNTIFPVNFVNTIKSKDKSKRKLHRRMRKMATGEPTIDNSHPRTPHIPPHITLTQQGSKSDMRPKKFQSVDSVQLSSTATPLHPPTRNHSQYQPPTQNSKRKQDAQPRPTQPVNLVEFSLKKMPAFPGDLPQDKQRLHPHERSSSMGGTKDGLPLVGTFTYSRREPRMDKTFANYEASVRPRVRNGRKLAFNREIPKPQPQQLPALCIMSETKKQFQRQQRNKPPMFEEIHLSETTYNRDNQVHQQQLAFERFREKQKPPIELLSKIGMEYFARYASNNRNRKHGLQ